MTIARTALMAWMAGMVAHAAQPPQTVTVYVRDRANVHIRVRIPAQALATRMFAEIGISLEWSKGEPAGTSSRPPIVLELRTNTPQSLKPGILAYAFPFEGSHLTIFFDRIEPMQNPSTVLAHVMVHEITHLLQGVTLHSASGVMKAQWTELDLCAMRRRPFAFTPDDVDLIYAGMASRGGTGTLIDRH